MAYNSKFTGAEIDEKLSNIVKITVGEGLSLTNGKLELTYTPARYYAGSSTPADTLGNNGDLYLQTSD